MSERFSDEVLQRAWDEAYLAWFSHTSDSDGTSDEAAKAAMRAVLEGHLAKQHRYSPYYDREDERVVMSIDPNGSWIHLPASDGSQK